MSSQLVVRDRSRDFIGTWFTLQPYLKGESFRPLMFSCKTALAQFLHYYLIHNPKSLLTRNVRPIFGAEKKRSPLVRMFGFSKVNECECVLELMRSEGKDFRKLTEDLFIKYMEATLEPGRRQQLRLCSAFSGGGFQELVLLARLKKAGINVSEINLVDIKYKDLSLAVSDAENAEALEGNKLKRELGVLVRFIFPDCKINYFDDWEEVPYHKSDVLLTIHPGVDEKNLKYYFQAIYTKFENEGNLPFQYFESEWNVPNSSIRFWMPKTGIREIKFGDLHPRQIGNIEKIFESYFPPKNLAPN